MISRAVIMHRYVSPLAQHALLIFCRCPDRENQLRGTESSWNVASAWAGIPARLRSVGAEGTRRLTMKNPRGNDRSGRRPDTNCGEHSRNTRGSSAERSSERNRRDLSLIAGCLVPLIGWRGELRFGATLVSSLRFTIGWCPASMTLDLADVCVSRYSRHCLFTANEIEQELPALTVY